MYAEEPSSNQPDWSDETFNNQLNWSRLCNKEPYWSEPYSKQTDWSKLCNGRSDWSAPCNKQPNWSESRDGESGEESFTFIFQNRRFSSSSCRYLHILYYIENARLYPKKLPAWPGMLEISAHFFVTVASLLICHFSNHQKGGLQTLNPF